MNTSQIHIPSLDKSQFYGYSNYSGGNPQQTPQQQYTLPQTMGGLGSMQFYPQQQQPAQQNQPCQQSSSIPEPPPSQNSQATSQQQSQFSYQTPFIQGSQQNLNQEEKRRRPWWMWAIGVVDIIAAIIFTVEVVQNVITKDRYVLDRDSLMWIFFLLFLSLCVQFLMGVGLLVGLKSTEDGTTFWYCQCWICGAYFLLGETGILLVSMVLKMHNGGEEIGAKLIICSIKITFRIISFLVVKRFMNDLRGKPIYRLNTQEIEQYQQQRTMQIQQLQQYQEQQRSQHHPSQRFPERDGSIMSGIEGRRGTRGSEAFCYVPPMSLMMSMMMDQDVVGGAA